MFHLDFSVIICFLLKYFERCNLLGKGSVCSDIVLPFLCIKSVDFVFLHHMPVHLLLQYNIYKYL